MIVNSINILDKFGAILTSKDIQNAEVINYSDWLDNSIRPIKTKEEKFKFNKITTTLFIEGNDEEEVLTKISNILTIVKSGTLKFLDIDYFFDVSLIDSSNEKIYSKGYKLKLNFKSDYKYKNEIRELINRITSKTINVTGNTETPAIVEIVPSMDIIDLTLTGFGDDPIIIKNLKMSKRIIIDGENEIVTEDRVNKFSDTDLWDFPSLKPGANTITVSRNNVDITIRYKPRWI